MSAVKRVTAVTLLVVAGITGGAGQVDAQQAGRGSEAPPIPLKVTVTISRFEGQKTTASLPFVLWVNTGENASVQMGGEVPVPQTTFSSAKEGVATPTTSYSYRSLGTVIACDAKALGDGLFRISLNVQDSQVFRQNIPGATGLIFQSFRSQNSPLLRDGQTVQFAVATDKTSGEVIKLEVTLNLVK